MQTEFPKVEYVLSDRRDKMAGEQIYWNELRTLRESICNTAVRKFVGLSKSSGQKIFLSEFLRSTYSSVNAYLSGNCKNKLLFDDFIFVADVAAKAMAAIVANPSTKLIKVEEQLKCNKLKNTGVKTMQWLAKRPGITIPEKIAPKNKVQTVSTKFSVDTKENEASMYLYSLLYTILTARIHDCDCVNCKNAACPDKALYEKIHKLYALKTQIKRSPLGEIPKIRHNVQNNKLMCDKNYKTVWDCNFKISRMENELKVEWENLAAALCKDVYFIILAIIFNSSDVMIKDRVGSVCVGADGVTHFRTADSGAEEVTFVHCGGSMRETTLSYVDGFIKVKTVTLGLNDSKFQPEATDENEYSLTELTEKIDSIISKRLLADEQKRLAEEALKGKAEEEKIKKELYERLRNVIAKRADGN